MAAWWHSWLCWTLKITVVGVVVAVVPESDGIGGGMHAQHDFASGRIYDSGLSCPSGCDCLLPRHVKCQAQPGDIHPPHPPRDTTTLILEGYRDIPSHLLANLNNLRYLRISGSDLEQISNLPHLPLLEQLEVTHSRLRTLNGRKLHSNIPVLTHLDVSHNLITVLNNTSLKGLYHLQVLDLRHNPLNSVHADTFQGLESLTYLDMSASQLMKLNHRWLVDAVNLQQLIISNASIEELPRLRGDHLILFDASHNSLLKLPDNMISSVSHLEELFLQHNPLEHVDVISLTGPKQLHYLDLSYTHIVNLDEFVFSKLSSLKELNLSYNKKLVRVEHGTFTGLHKMDRLNLAHTPSLREIEEVAFDGLPDLVNLDLQNSGLTVLPLSLNKLANRTSVLLSGTAIHCDCYHYWLPKLLTQSDISSWNGVDPFECTDGQFRNVTQLTAHIDNMACESPEAITPSDEWIQARGGQSALLECNVTANPPQSVIWLTAQQEVFRYNTTTNSDRWISHHIHEVEEAAAFNARFEVLASGHLLIKDVRRSDTGRYKCFAFNSVGNTSIVTFMGLEDTPLRNLYTESLLFGFACAALFLLITLIVQLINYLMDRMGLQCCCCRDRLSPKARQIRKLLESVESYKSQQLDRLRENYNAQVASIKDSCYFQMERIRESYGGQTKHLKDLREYSTQGLTSVKDQYVDQVNKVRDYSVSQMNRVRENYVFQRHRIRKFSAQQLLKLRETYKYQQKTLNKILENLPDLYLQNCRTGGCHRSDSILFDDALHGIDAYYRVDFFDTQSHGSDYYTPASTLTRSFRASRPHDPNKLHSRTSSNTSSDFMEAQTWIQRESGSLGGNSPTHGNPHLRTHNRSMSMANPASYIPEPVRVHKRSLSATHPTRRVVPAPELRGMPARITLCEEVSDYDLATPPTSPSSLPGTPITSSIKKPIKDVNDQQPFSVTVTKTSEAEPKKTETANERLTPVDFSEDTSDSSSAKIAASDSDSLNAKVPSDSDSLNAKVPSDSDSLNAKVPSDSDSKALSEENSLPTAVAEDSSSGSTSYETSL